MREVKIERFKSNPLIRPDPRKKWMTLDVFNCGVIKDDDGLYKMLFRAAYTVNQSHSDIGLALSHDGEDWTVFNKPVLRSRFNEYCTRGIEDPRIVKWIDNWYYIFATACMPGKGRVGIWRTKNFFDYEWVGIPIDKEDKDASIIPEPIDGWAYLIHRLPPDMWITRTKDLTLRAGWQDNQLLISHNQSYLSPNTEFPPEKIGIAGPPIKTPKGWLVITHTVHSKDEYDGRLYTLGLCVLDPKDPAKVIYIHPKPILIPEDPWEIEGRVRNVVFSCATVDTGKDDIYVYWGGANTVICGGRLRKEDLKGICY